MSHDARNAIWEDGSRAGLTNAAVVVLSASLAAALIPGVLLALVLAVVV